VSTFVPVVEKSSIQVGTMLGDGGEGEVYEIAGKPNDVLKLFKPAVQHELSESGLSSTIGLLPTMSSNDQSVVKRQSVWPHTLVKENGRFVGFIMPALTKDYFCRHGQKGNTVEGMNDWNKLTFRKAWISNNNLESNCPPLWYPNGQKVEDLDDQKSESRQDLLTLLENLAKLFEVFHRYRIVVGDVSGRNILWSRVSGTDVMLIDCDGCRLENTVGVTRAKQSPDWFDPDIPANSPTNLRSDEFKLAIALYRGYFADGLGMPMKGSAAFSSDLDREFHEMAIRGVSSGGRPSAAEWVAQLKKMKSQAEFAGRPVVDWRTPLPGEQPIQITPVIQPDQQRPNIQI
jgi:DNA-binding helix-hairpin-helix protein with protein kinase domain